MEAYITSQHRYYTLDYYLKNRFNKKVFKIALNGNFTCPNRDGTLSKLGCLFCSEEGSGEFGGQKEEPLQTQFQHIQQLIHQKWPNGAYIVYFQAYTNTYGPIEKLQEMFETAITLHPDIVAISIATRPDCLPIEVLDYLEDLNTRIPVWIELGLQSIHEETAIAMNRGYKLSTFEQAVIELANRNIETIVHIINGLPNETKEMMVDTIHYLNTLPIKGIKFHSLFIVDTSPLYQQYLKKPFDLLSLDDYVSIIVSQLSILRKDIVVHRISGDAPNDRLIAPDWSKKKFVVMNEIDKKMKELQLFQGCLYDKRTTS